MLCVASISTWAQGQQNPTILSNHAFLYEVGNGAYKQLLITDCERSDGAVCNHTLKEILQEIGATSTHYDLVTIKLDEKKNKVVEGVPMIKAYALDLRGVANLSAWKNIKNQYVSNVLLANTVGQLNNNVIENFNSDRLYNVITVRVCNPCHEVDLDVYINKPGFLANGLQYISDLDPAYSWNATWWNTGTLHEGNGYTYNTKLVTMLRVSGYVFARDLMARYDPKLTPEGHMPPGPQEITYQSAYSFRPGTKCTNPLAPSYHDKNVIYFSEPGSYGNDQGAVLGSHISRFDFIP